MEVLGVALATLITQYLSAFLVLGALLRCREVYGVRLSRLSLDREKARMVLALGIPSAMQNAIFQVANLFIQTGVNSFDADYARARIREGYGSAISYGFVYRVNRWAPQAMKPGDSDSFFDYDVVAAAIPRAWDSMCRQTVLPYAVALPTGWDDRVRSFQNSLVIHDRTPAKFAAVCRAAREFCDRTGNRNVVIHPLNEWQEGSYVEPCDEYGFGMYEAIRDAFCRKPSGGWPKNLSPAEAGCALHEFPPPVRSAKQAWDFERSTEGWYRQPYGGGEVAWQDGALTFVINRPQYYSIRQCVQPFEAARYTTFAVRMRVTPNAREGLAGSRDLLCRLKWGTAESRNAVLPIPAGTDSLTVDGVPRETGLDGAAGWYGLVVDGTSAAPQVVRISGEGWSASADLHGKEGISVILR